MKLKVKKIAESGAETLTDKIIVPFLTIASIFYSVIIGIRKAAFKYRILRKNSLSFPVVSVGNITWGGTGKTPFIKYLTSKIEEQSKKVMILTRGYSHDEVLELESSCPQALIAVGKDRHKTATRYLNGRDFDIALLDDGFQHVQLKRDLDVLLINGACPFGTNNLIPLGSLREPLSELNRADVIVLTHRSSLSQDDESFLKQKIEHYAPEADLIEAEHELRDLFRASSEESLKVGSFLNQSVACVSGIGFPESFYRLVECMGIRVEKKINFLDHHNFSIQELKKIKKLKDDGLIQEVFTTEKDWMRQKDIWNKWIDPVVVSVKLKIVSGEEKLDARLNSLYSR